jgi:pimeloyl-ACP methyl ester carboxylesterase
LQRDLLSWRTAQASTSYNEAAANTFPRIIFAYIFDESDLAGYTADMQAYLWESVWALRESIRSCTDGHADLFIMRGSAPRALAALCDRFINVRVLVEDDWCESSQQCFRECRELGITLDLWNSASSHRNDKPIPPMAAIPSGQELDCFTNGRHRALESAVGDAVQNDLLALYNSVRDIGLGIFVSLDKSDSSVTGQEPLHPCWFSMDRTDYQFTKKVENEKLLCQILLNEAGGETAAFDRLRDYLNDPNIHQERDFLRSFWYPLHFGCISSRRIEELLEATNFERHLRRLMRLEMPRIRDAKALTLSLRWHLFLAQQDRIRECSWKYWRWNGLVVRFSEQRSNIAEAPAVLFIHGFGASIEHWEQNASYLAGRGYHVYCLDLIGFGRSTKPATRYTQELWERQVRDFVLQIVRQPVYIIGNSIGAYISLAFAADHVFKVSGSEKPTIESTLCRGVVLINPAGPIEAPANASSTSSRPGFRRLLSTPFASRIAGEVLLRYLRRNIRRTLLRVYPVRPHAALRMEQIIYRHSLDPGAVSVIASGFRLPPARPIPELLNALYPLPVLLIQGVLDPLNNGKLRAERIAGARSDIRVVCLEAGHCPHDEVADEVNMRLLEWLDSCEQASEPLKRMKEPPFYSSS